MAIIMLFPTEIWLLVIQFLSTRDLVFLSLTYQHLKYIADDEIKKRLDINNVRSKYVADVDRFRSVTRATKSFIIGNFTIAFFYPGAFQKENQAFVHCFFA